MKFFPLIILLAGLCLALPGVQGQEPKALSDLKALVERQRILLLRAERADHPSAIEDLREPLQRLVFDYERYLRENPEEVAGYVSYAMLLGNSLLEERGRAVALLMKANQLDAHLPLVKNQLGNFVAEEGQPLMALNYFLSAVELEPTEPLYHYQVGTLLTAAREDFLKSGEWTREAIDRSMHQAFEQAMTLAPDNLAYAYRYWESFYDLQQPDWNKALAGWRALEERMESPVERQTIRLHQANVLIKQGCTDEARDLLATVTESVLTGQKQKLVAQLAEPAEE